MKVSHRTAQNLGGKGLEVVPGHQAPPSTEHSQNDVTQLTAGVWTQ